MDTQELTEKLAPAVEKEGYLLFGLNISKGKETTLSITVDRDDPISLSDLESLSEKISALLDELDPFENPYTLDISSLGVEKPIDLNLLEKEWGRYVNLHLSNPFKGLNTLEGYLEKGKDEGSIILRYYEKGKERKAEIRLKDIDRARRAVEL